MRIASGCFLVALLASGMGGCAARSRHHEPTATPLPPAVETTPPRERQPEPAGASREELETVPPPPSVRPLTEGWLDEPPVPPANQTTLGYRVQLFAGATYDAAVGVADRARGQFTDEVVIEYEAPLYKVRVGNCVTRHDADRIREQAIDLGYEGPFIAETMIHR